MEIFFAPGGSLRDAQKGGYYMMFREMRRKRQQMGMEACEEVLRRGTSGVLALEGDGGYPYAVPLSYVYAGGRIYFHSGKAGHKLDAIQRNPKASFCVIGQDEVVAEEYTSYFRSVVVFGEIHVLEGDAEKWGAIELLARKYAPEDSAANRRRAIEREWAPLCMLELSIAHISGKEAIELVREKEREQ